MKTLLLAALALALIAAPDSRSAAAGSIRGQIHVPPLSPAPARARDPYAGRASAIPNPRVPERGAPKDAVVYIESLDASVNEALPAPPARPKLAQEQQSFLPRVVVVPAGGSVEFPNKDPIYHSVFSVSPAKRFDLGRYGRGTSKRVTFPKAGLVTVYCDIHSNMEGFVFVAPNRAVAQPDESGRFALPDLPPGRYTLLAWHPDLTPLRREVTVPESGDVDLDLRFAP
ncbi:MAG TPA: carboxypeptidase regulatory-like domain-containing protein [Candidatus Eisenbacteria bacterium]|nr:carboxypeptidase regulatory-like domain-containing protein [Candidatus Eisenbacteria bacterium]